LIQPHCNLLRQRRGDRKQSRFQLVPMICYASILALARPWASISPSYATVSCTTLPLQRTERTSRRN
jgi:hypothetical protein